MSEFYCGIEGGGTRSSLVLMNKKAEIVYVCEGAATNHYLVGWDGCVREICGMIEYAKAKIGIPDGLPLAGVGLCISGMDVAEEREKLEKIFTRDHETLSKVYYVGTDAVGAAAAGCKEGGIVVVAGTGSTCVKLGANGSFQKVGGWGHMLGEHGSAFRIVQQALELCFEVTDGVPVAGFPDPTFVVDAACAHFNVTRLDQVINAFYGQAFDKATVAALCVKLAEGARQGDEICKRVFYDAGRYLGTCMRVLAGTSQGVRPHRNILEANLGVDPEQCTSHSQDPVETMRVVCVGSLWKSFPLLRRGVVDGYFDADERFASRPQVEAVFSSATPPPVPHTIELARLRGTVGGASGAAMLAARKAGEDLPFDYATAADVFYRFSSAEDATDNIVLCKPVDADDDAPVIPHPLC